MIEEKSAETAGPAERKEVPWPKLYPRKEQWKQFITTRVLKFAVDSVPINAKILKNWWTDKPVTSNILISGENIPQPTYQKLIRLMRKGGNADNDHSIAEDL